MRRATAVWVGCAIVGAIVFGPTGMQPHDLTSLALRVPPVGLALGVTWLLLFVPSARLVVRAEPARFLGSLPHGRLAPWVIGGLALIGLQLPWIALWLAGEHARGLAAVAITTALAALAAIPTLRPRPARIRRLAAAYVAGIRRTAADALVRGAGLAVLAGVAGGLFVRNNQLIGGAAGVMASAVIAIVLVPAVAGVLLPLLDAHRKAAWLARSLGHSEQRRIAALAAVSTAAYALAGALAAGAAAAVVGDLPTAGAIAGLALATSISCGVVAARLLVWADRSDAAPASRVVVGAVLAAALAVAWLGWLGVSGAAGLAACAAFSIAKVIS